MCTASQTDTQTAAPPPLSVPMVLVIDDNEAQRYATGIALSRAGFRVLEADTGEKGLVLAAREAPTVVVCDICLPGIDGFEVCRQLKARPGAAQIPVVLYSAAAQDGCDALRGRGAGACAYLYSPVEAEQLVTVVRGAIAIGKARASRS